MLSAATTMISLRISDHDVALDLDGVEERRIPCRCQVSTRAIGPGGAGDRARPCRRSCRDRSPSVSRPLTLSPMLKKSCASSSGMKTKDESYWLMPMSKVPAIRVGLDARRGAERRDVAARRDQRDRHARRESADCCASRAPTITEFAVVVVRQRAVRQACWRRW